MSKKLRVYLAGPMTNCNEKQRTEWRKRIQAELPPLEYEVLDPTGRAARSGALAVTSDIEAADVVIANLWTISIGTIVGILHAHRNGVPVILLDEHYIDSPILASITDHIVRSEQAAINKLKDSVAPALRRELWVEKRRKPGQPVSFSLKKLEKSLKRNTAQAGIDNPILDALLSRRVKRALFERDAQVVTTQQIKQTIFVEMNKLASEPDVLASLGENAPELLKLQKIWEDHEHFVKEERVREEDFNTRIAELESEICKLRTERDDVFSILQASPPPQEVSIEAANEGCGLEPLIEATTTGRKILCVSIKGSNTFSKRFDRIGMKPEVFERFFVEEQIDGVNSPRSSKTKEDIPKKASSYAYVLYALYSLRHLNWKPDNLIEAPTIRDVVREFGTRLQRDADRAIELVGDHSK
jgi:nucleoside 2-deoxyribosyltransferase